MHQRLLILLLSFGLIVRLVSLESAPAGFTPDEAAFGYNAYSILRTGADEWGTPWYKLPFTNLKSFGDYKLPLYTFLALPSVAIFGLTQFAIRLPNALIGTVAILAIYQFTNTLFPNKKNLGLFSALFLAFSPWHISMSRGAFEANLITLGLPAMVTTYLNQKYFRTALWASFNIYAYHSARFLTPFALLATWILYPTHLKKLYPALTLLALLGLPAVFSTLGSGASRASDVSIFSPTDNWQSVSDSRYQAVQSGLPDSLARIISNKPLYLISLFTHNYLSYFSPTYLFTSGAGEWSYGTISGTGLLLFVQFPLLLLFIYKLCTQPQKSHWLLLILLFLAPLPAALSKGPGFAANRTVLMAPLLCVISAVGLVQFRRFYLICFLGILIGFGFWVLSYAYPAQNQLARHGFYQWPQISQEISALSPAFTQIRVSRGLSEPHIALAFYTQIDPVIYQQASKSWPDPHANGFKFLDQHDGLLLGKYRFGDIHPQDPVDVPTLFVGRPEEFPPTLTPLKTYLFPDSEPSLIISASYPNHP